MKTEQYNNHQASISQIYKKNWSLSYKMSAPKFSALFSANQARRPICSVASALLFERGEKFEREVYCLWAGISWREFFGRNMMAGINWRCPFLAGCFPGGIFFLAVNWNLPHIIFINRFSFCNTNLWYYHENIYIFTFVCLKTNRNI